MAKEENHAGTSGVGTGRLIALVIVAIASATLIFGNLDSTSVWLWGFTVDMPLFVILIVVFILGMFLGGFVRSGVRKLRGVDKA